MKGTLVIKKLLMERSLGDKIISLNLYGTQIDIIKITGRGQFCNLRLLQVCCNMPETATGKGHGLFQTHYYALYQSVDIAFLFSLSLWPGRIGELKC